MKKNKKSTFFESKIYKEITAKVYGIGASIVIIGCLFKILHLPGAAMMLGSGLIIEALIFLISAFEPLHKEVDWARVYPELEDDIEQEDIPASPVLQRNSGTMMFNDHAMPQLSEEQFESLKNSILKMGETADQMAVLSDITMASSNLAQQIEGASQTTMTFNKAVANDLLKHEQYMEEVDKVANELESLQKGYKLLSEEVNHSVKETASSISKLNKSVEVSYDAYNNLSYQVSTTANHYKTKLNMLSNSFTITENIDSQESEILNNVKELQEEMIELKTKISSLNKVYNNMLLAVS